MTTYVVTRNFAGSGVPSIGVLAVTYPIRVSRVEFYGGLAGSSPSPPTTVVTFVNNISGAGFSGGTSITPLPMRGGAPPSTATSKYGYTSSGTKVFLAPISAGGGAGPTSSNYSFPFDYIVPPGSAVDVSQAGSLTSSYTWMVAIYYEELRLAWSF